MDDNKRLHVAMYPWFAIGHITPFLHLANKLAERGNKVSFFLPTNAQPKFASYNHHPNLITFVPITFPPVEGLPAGAATTADLPVNSHTPLYAAMDLTLPIMDSYLGPSGQTSPIDVVFFDYAFWLPSLARKHGIKSVYFDISSASYFAYMNPRARGVPPGMGSLLSEADLRRAPPGFPSSITLSGHEARLTETLGSPGRCYFHWRWSMAVEESDAICFKGCKEMEGYAGECLQKLYPKPILWAGSVVSRPPASNDGLARDMKVWLEGFEPRSVVYCALGSEAVLEKAQFQQLALGLELTGLPFLAVLKPPKGCKSVESCLPEIFLERTKKRGIIQSEWVQQQLILQHPSVGCFVTHCGAGSVSEALVTECQLVLLPQKGDQSINARLMDRHLKVGLEIERGEEDGVFSKEAVCEAIRSVMDSKNEVANVIRANHHKWRDCLLKDELEESYISHLVENLRAL